MNNCYETEHRIRLKIVRENSADILADIGQALFLFYRTAIIPETLREIEHKIKEILCKWEEKLSVSLTKDSVFAYVIYSNLNVRLESDLGIYVDKDAKDKNKLIVSFI